MKQDNVIWWLQLISLVMITIVFALNIKQYITCECFYTWVGTLLLISLLYFLFQTFVVKKCFGYIHSGLSKWTTKSVT